MVGVAPAGFSGMVPGIEAEFWVPVMMIDRLSFQGMQGDTDNDPGTTRLQRRGQHWLFVKARLATGRTVEQARSQVDTIFARLRKDYPITNEKARATVLPGAGVRFHPMLDGYVKAASAVLLAAVALVLTIACANVANMLLARGASRRRELAVRAALGARPGDVLRLVLRQGGRLALVGIGAGALLAALVGRVLGSLLYGVSALDPIAYAVAAAILLAVAALASLVPAVTAARVDPLRALRSE
ncbi:MAG: hypothetical protein DMF82_04915 [Acidobacteria bacterium]|nr:MAG: hypothetical protein DMF82_04915 [Acidobacteriota bacterium]